MRDIMKQRQWVKDNTTALTGLRVNKPVQLYNQNMQLVTVTPNDFLYSSSRKETYQIYGKEDVEVHVPRSLCRRARIVVNREGTIIATSAMNSRNK